MLSIEGRILMQTDAWESLVWVPWPLLLGPDAPFLLFLAPHWG